MNNNRQGRIPVILSIAGSDNTAGAGIQADIKTASACGLYCTTVITAVTAQNPSGVKAVGYVGDKMLRNQLEATLDYLRPDAVKIGMISETSAVKIVTDIIRKYKLSNIICDPVLSATSGGTFAENQDLYLETLVSELFPLTDLITPNIPELEQILNIEGRITTTAIYGFLNKRHIRAILVKGGHSETSVCTDRLYKLSESSPIEFSATRINTRNTHGTGCTLSSAIACGLASGLSLEKAIEYGRDFLLLSMKRAVDSNLFTDNGPLYHFDYKRK